MHDTAVGVGDRGQTRGFGEGAAGGGGVVGPGEGGHAVGVAARRLVVLGFGRGLLQAGVGVADFAGLGAGGARGAGVGGDGVELTQVGVGVAGGLVAFRGAGRDRLAGAATGFVVGVAERHAAGVGPRGQGPIGVVRDGGEVAALVAVELTDDAAAALTVFERVGVHGGTQVAVARDRAALGVGGQLAAVDVVGGLVAAGRGVVEIGGLLGDLARGVVGVTRGAVFVGVARFGVGIHHVLDHGGDPAQGVVLAARGDAGVVGDVLHAARVVVGRLRHQNRGAVGRRRVWWTGEGQCGGARPQGDQEAGQVRHGTCSRIGGSRVHGRDPIRGDWRTERPAGTWVSVDERPARRTRGARLR